MPKEISILCTVFAGSNLIEEAAAHGIAIDAIPFIEIEYIETPDVVNRVNELADKKLDVVFTSNNAVMSVAEMIQYNQDTWRIYCLDGKTKTAVNQLFNNDCKIVADTSTQLAQGIIQAGVKHITFFCSNIRMDTLPGILSAAGVQVEEHIVYKTIETPHKVSKQYDGILFFSPSGVRSFFTANSITEKTTLFAIGSTTAGHIKEYTDAAVIVSPVQSKKAVIETAINFFKR